MISFNLRFITDINIDSTLTRTIDTVLPLDAPEHATVDRVQHYSVMEINVREVKIKTRNNYYGYGQWPSPLLAANGRVCTSLVCLETAPALPHQVYCRNYTCICFFGIFKNLRFHPGGSFRVFFWMKNNV